MATATRTTYTPVGRPPYSNTNYDAQTGPAELTEYGGVSESPSDDSVSKTVWTPPLVTVLTARPGETITAASTMVVDSTVKGVAQPTITKQISESALFVGFEAVTIAAGSFPACRFEQKHSGPQGPTTTYWRLRGHGILLKSHTPASAVDGGGTEELLSLLVNGAVPQ